MKKNCNQSLDENQPLEQIKELSFKYSVRNYILSKAVDMKQDTGIFLNRRSLFQVLWFLKIIIFETVQRMKSCPPDVISIPVTLDLTHSTMDLSTYRPERSDKWNLGYIQCTLTCTLLFHSRCTCIVGIKTGLLCQFYSGHQ